MEPELAPPPAPPSSSTRDPSTLPLPPSPGRLSAVTDTLAFLRDPVRLNRRRGDALGPIWRTHLLGSPTVFVSGAEAL